MGLWSSWLATRYWLLLTLFLSLANVYNLSLFRAVFWGFSETCTWLLWCGRAVHIFLSLAPLWLLSGSTLSLQDPGTLDLWLERRTVNFCQRSNSPFSLLSNILLCRASASRCSRRKPAVSPLSPQKKVITLFNPSLRDCPH